jgi:hypothetical protein
MISDVVHNGRKSKCEEVFNNSIFIIWKGRLTEVINSECNERERECVRGKRRRGRGRSNYSMESGVWRKQNDMG